MAGIKRPSVAADTKASKKVKVISETPVATKTPPSPSKSKRDLNGLDVENQRSVPTVVEAQPKKQNEKYRPQAYRAPEKQEPYLSGQTSREAHAKQKSLAQGRKAAKPHADSIARSKEIWERIRLKSHVPREERVQLVEELFQIITGRVKDFVFKHDSVRVIQCALKYATPAQKKQITGELKGSYRELAESKYAKFLIAKMVVRDDESRDTVVEEFYGHIKRLIRHPEAGWIVDDIYRTIATKQQQAIMLREWYGPEFVVFGKNESAPEKVTAELSEILAQNPEKRGPIMQHLREMTNQLVQKKTTGFTILHDALLQYFLNCKQGSPEITEFLSMLGDDEEGDCYKNLAFTKSGSRLVCLALAHGNSKVRRSILKVFKTHIKLLATDHYGHAVLLTAYEVIDDTVMTSKAIFPELLSKDLDNEAHDQELMAQAEHLTARIPLLYLMSPDPPKWLLKEDSFAAAIIKEVREIRTSTSKKDPETRRTELLKTISQPLVELIASRAKFLVQSSFGCQFVTETLLGAVGEKEAALAAIAELATKQAESEEITQAMSKPSAERMLKSLVQGGRFDTGTQRVKLVEPLLNFHELLYSAIKEKAQEGRSPGLENEILTWANGPTSLVILAMLEADDFSHREEVTDILRRNKEKLNRGRKPAMKILEKIGESATHTLGVAAVDEGEQRVEKEKGKKGKKSKQQ